jgi:tetratricopeptide (TPR) repeat protein
MLMIAIQLCLAVPLGFVAPEKPDITVLKKPIATTQPIGPDMPAQEVINDFLGYLGKSADPKARELIAAARARPASDTQIIQDALAALTPRLKEALDLLEKEQGSSAVEILLQLAKVNDPYVGVTAASLAATTLIEQERFGPAKELLLKAIENHPPLTRFTQAPDHVEFMLGYCQVHDLEYEEALATFTDFLRRYPQAPERLRVTATQIVTELSRRIPGKLGDVHDLMNVARRGLSHGEADDVVVKRQGEAVALLDKLIKDAEDQEKSKGDNGGEGGKSGKPSSPKQPSGGAKQSVLPAGQEKETVLRQTKASPGETWGKMPPKQREEILQSIQKQFPSRYRDLLEQYYKQLAKDQPAP